MEHLTHLVLVSGFLGAGKTSLILAAAHELARRGLRSAIILNDQSDSLVDTEFAHLHEIESGEVTGGCFCCRLSALIDVAQTLRAHAPHVIFAEPVGSCTDLSATIVHPLMNSYATDFQVAPITVLVDPTRAFELLRTDADPHMAFLFRNQLDEADLVCFTKADLGLGCPDLEHVRTRQLSARTNQGVAAWLDEVLSGDITAGAQLLDIDYEEYARAEAALAWLNLDVRVECTVPRSPAMMLGPFLDGIDTALTSAKIPIVHLKGLDQCDTGFIKAAITANGQEPDVQGDLTASPAVSHRLLINLRAVGSAADVREIVEAQIAHLPGLQAGMRLTCFSPAAPVPEQRVLA